MVTQQCRFPAPVHTEGRQSITPGPERPTWSQSLLAGRSQSTLLVDSLAGWIPGPTSVPALSMGVFFNFLGTLALGAFVPTIASELHTSVALIGQVPALMMLLAGALGLVIGPIADQFGCRQVLLWSLLAGIMTALGTAMAPTYQGLLLVGLAGALGRAAVQPVAQAVVVSHFDGNDRLRRRAMSRVSAGSAGAGILGIPLLTTLSEFLGWRGSFYILAGTGMLVVLAVAGVLRPQPSARRPGLSIRGLLEPYQPLLRHTLSLSTITATVLGSAGIWVVWTYVAAHFVQRYQLNSQELGWIYLVTGVAALLGTLLAGGRLGRRPMGLLITARAGSVVDGSGRTATHARADRGHATRSRDHAARRLRTSGHQSLVRSCAHGPCYELDTEWLRNESRGRHGKCARRSWAGNWWLLDAWYVGRGFGTVCSRSGLGCVGPRGCRFRQRDFSSPRMRI